VKGNVTNLFGQIQGSVQSFIDNKFGSKACSDSEKTPTFTITPSTTTIESSHSPEEPRSVSLPEETKNDIDSALATFYEEITNAAKQVFAGKCFISKL